MSKSVKRRVSSLSFSINKLYRSIVNFRPPTLLIPILVVAFSIFLFSGGVYDLVQKPLTAVYYNNQFLFLNPYLSEQFVSDSVVAAIIYSLGVLGLLMIYQSTKYVYKPRQAYMMLLIGLTLLFLSYVAVEATINLKLHGQ